MSAITPLESKLEQEVVKLATDLDCLALKLIEDGKRGFPDRTILGPGGMSPLFLELKRAKSGRASEQQRRNLRRLTDLGYVAEIADNLTDAERIINEWKRINQKK